MANNPTAFMTWTLRQAASCTVRERIMVYRNLADICADDKEAKRLKLMADSLECADRECAEFAFNLDLKGGTHAA